MKLLFQDEKNNRVYIPDGKKKRRRETINSYLRAVIPQ